MKQNLLITGIWSLVIVCVVGIVSLFIYLPTFLIGTEDKQEVQAKVDSVKVESAKENDISQEVSRIIEKYNSKTYFFETNSANATSIDKEGHKYCKMTIIFEENGISDGTVNAYSPFLKNNIIMFKIRSKTELSPPMDGIFLMGTVWTTDGYNIGKYGWLPNYGYVLYLT